MNVGRTVFSQLMDFVPYKEFRRIVKHYRGEHRVRRFSCWEQYLAMAFAQLTYRESLRDIEACLRSLGPTLYHSGLRSTVSRSTLADANEHRSWKIYQDLALLLIERARVLYRDDRLLEDIESAVYALDATTIELCLALFPWARAQSHQATTAGVKLHTLLDVQRNLPVFARVSIAHLYEVYVLDDLVFEPGAFYFLLDANLIAQLYRSRWKIELFFKWVKQHLRIKAFYGTSPNAVNTQIWIALSIFVLVAIVKKELKLDAPLYTILQILSVTLFEKEPINQVLTATTLSNTPTPPANQLNLFRF
jgi:hypothetical protein